MNYWLKTSSCLLILLLGQSQAALAVEETSQPILMATGPEHPDEQGGPVSCLLDGICNFNGCQDTPDPDCPGPGLAGIPKNVALTISRYTTSTLTNADADAILAEATEILQTDNGPDDVSCLVTFTRDGPVTTFTTGDGSIDSPAEFNTVLGLPGYVAVVNQITWCGGFVGSAGGCAQTPGSSFVVTRKATIHKDAIAWAHEYGHTVGLPHRSGNVVMEGKGSPKATRVNITECNAYHQAGP